MNSSHKTAFEDLEVNAVCGVRGSMALVGIKEETARVTVGKNARRQASKEGRSALLVPSSIFGADRRNALMTFKDGLLLT